MQNHLDPFYEGDAQGDMDNDGISNLFEYQHNLSIQQADTEYDSINNRDNVQNLSYIGIPENELYATSYFIRML